MIPIVSSLSTKKTGRYSLSLRKMPSSIPGRQSGVSFETGSAAEEKEVEFEFEGGAGPTSFETLSSGEIAVHFNATLSEPFQGPAEAERLYLWGNFDYLRAENEKSKEWFEAF